MTRSIEAIQIESGGAYLKGKSFLAGKPGQCPTAIVVPGWPGNPDDVLELGDFLSHGGVNVVVFNPRGFHDSEGVASFAHTLQDIGAVVQWILSHSNKYPRGYESLFLGGYSFGGGLAMAYASRDPSIRRIFSIAGTDHAQIIRQYGEDESYAAMLKEALQSTAAPQGPVRFNVGSTLDELRENQNVYGLRENAAHLADRSLLIVGGWEDNNVTIEDHLLPFYRELRKMAAGDVRFLVFHDDHGFSRVREEMSAAVLEWILSMHNSA